MCSLTWRPTITNRTNELFPAGDLLLVLTLFADHLSRKIQAVNFGERMGPEEPGQLYETRNRE